MSDQPITHVAEVVNDDEFNESMHEGAESAKNFSQEKADRYYDRVRTRIREYISKKGNTLGKTADYLLLVPDVFILLWRLVNDARVSGKNKVLLGSTIAYYVFPFDLIPEGFVGPIGYLDDLVFAVYVLNKILHDVDADVLRKHWSGNEDVLQTIQRVMNAADQLVGSELLEKIKRFVK